MFSGSNFLLFTGASLSSLSPEPFRGGVTLDRCLLLDPSDIDNLSRDSSRFKALVRSWYFSDGRDFSAVSSFLFSVRSVVELLEAILVRRCFSLSPLRSLPEISFRRGLTASPSDDPTTRSDSARLGLDGGALVATGECSRSDPARSSFLGLPGPRLGEVCSSLLPKDDERRFSFGLVILDELFFLEVSGSRVGLGGPRLGGLLPSEFRAARLDSASASRSRLPGDLFLDAPFEFFLRAS